MTSIPSRFSTANFKNYVAEKTEQKRMVNLCANYAKQFVELPQNHTTNLLMLGKVGTGKTHLACAIARFVNLSLGPIRMRSRDPMAYPVVYSTVIGAVRAIRATYGDSHNREDDAIAKYSKAKLLVLDEVGVQSGSDHEKMLMTDILDSRWSNGLNTIVISNYPRNELREFLGARAFDRLLDGDSMVLPFTWDSYRGKENKTNVIPQAYPEPEPEPEATGPGDGSGARALAKLRRDLGFKKDDAA